MSLDNDQHKCERAQRGAGLSKLSNVAGALIVATVAFSAGMISHQNGASFLGASSAAATEEPQDPDFLTYEADHKWAQKLREGGYILYIRHAQREKWNDVTAFDAIELLNKDYAENTSYRRAVCLTEQGVEESKLIGEVFKHAGVQVDKVVASPSCRARQTASNAFGHIDKISSALLHRTAIMKSQHKDFATATRKIVDELNPAAGKNDVIVAHAGTMRYDGNILIDINETGGKLDDRDETGFVVLEKKDGKVIARHKFHSIKRLAYASLELPVDSEGPVAKVNETAPKP